MKFDPKEVEKAIKIDKDGYSVDKNTWYPGLLESEPNHVLVFPYAQHMLSDSPGNSSLLKDVEAMLEAKNAIALKYHFPFLIVDSSYEVR